MNKLAFTFLLGAFLSCTSKTEHAKLTFLLKGNESFEENDLDKANYYYKEAILTDSTYVDAYLNNALVLEAKGELYGAIEMYDAVLALNPEDENALYKRANLYLDVDQYYRALDDLKGLGKSWEDSAKLYFTKGLINTRLKRYDVAIQEFRNSLKKNAEQAQSLINIGNVFYYKNELDSATQYLNKGLELDPSEANGLNTLGLVATRKKEFDDALVFFNKALDLDANNGWYINNKGFVFIQLSQLDSASYLINKSMKLDPYNAWVYRNKGLIEIERGNLSNGIKMFEKAYKMDKSIDHLTLDLANAYHQFGDDVKACEILNLLAEADSSAFSDYCS